MSSLVLTLRVRPPPKPPSPQQIIAGCQFCQPYIGEAVHHLNRDRATRRKATCPAHTPTASGHTVLIRFTMKAPHSNSRGARHSCGDLCESGGTAPVSDCQNLVGAAATHAEEALTVRVVLVATDGLELAAFHLAQHSAKRWM